MPRLNSYVLPVECVELLQKIPNQFAEVLLATRTLDFPSHRYLAAYLQIPEGTVKSRLSRGKRLLANLQAAPKAA